MGLTNWWVSLLKCRCSKASRICSSHLEVIFYVRNYFLFYSRLFLSSYWWSTPGRLISSTIRWRLRSAIFQKIICLVLRGTHPRFGVSWDGTAICSWFPWLIPFTCWDLGKISLFPKESCQKNITHTSLRCNTVYSTVFLLYSCLYAHTTNVQTTEEFSSGKWFSKEFSIFSFMPNTLFTRSCMSHRPPFLPTLSFFPFSNLSQSIYTKR